MRYEAVVFDFGGVLVDGPFDAFTAIESASGARAGAVREINARNPDDNAWARLERGEIDEDEFVVRFEAEAADLGHDVPGRKVIDVVSGASSGLDAARPVMLDALDRCRERGLRLGLITNNIRPLHESWVLDRFDAVVQSSIAGMRKPEAAIYEHLAGELGVRLDRSIMLDDLGINLKPARALGMATIKVGDPDAAVAELFALLDTDTC